MRIVPLVIATILSSLTCTTVGAFADDDDNRNDDKEEEDSLKVYEDFFTQDDFDLILKHKQQRENETDCAYGMWKEYTSSFLTIDQTRRVLGLIGKTEPSSCPLIVTTDKCVILKELQAVVGEEEGQSVVRRPHLDHTHTDHDYNELISTGDDDVAFIFANTNQNASFVFHHERNDYEGNGFVQEVPVKKGNLVVFKGGSHYHYTSINSGVVKLVGPFLASLNNKPVGAPDTPSPTQPTPQPTEITASPTQPTPQPTAVTQEPTRSPTASPTIPPTMTTPLPTAPTPQPTEITASPTQPTPQPTANTSPPTMPPTMTPTDDPCAPNPCLNGGTCNSSGGSFTCMCFGPFIGTNCQTLGTSSPTLPPTFETSPPTMPPTSGTSPPTMPPTSGTNPPTMPPTGDPCDSFPCLNGGTCTSASGSFTCMCNDGFTGPTCSMPATSSPTGTPTMPPTIDNPNACVDDPSNECGVGMTAVCTFSSLQFRDECFLNGLIENLGQGDKTPDNDRVIISCGCCGGQIIDNADFCPTTSSSSSSSSSSSTKKSPSSSSSSTSRRSSPSSASTKTPSSSSSSSSSSTKKSPSSSSSSSSDSVMEVRGRRRNRQKLLRNNPEEEDEELPFTTNKTTRRTRHRLLRNEDPEEELTTINN